VRAQAGALLTSHIAGITNVDWLQADAATATLDGFDLLVASLGRRASPTPNNSTPISLPSGIEITCRGALETKRNGGRRDCGYGWTAAENRV